MLVTWFVLAEALVKPYYSASFNICRYTICTSKFTFFWWCKNNECKQSRNVFVNHAQKQEKHKELPSEKEHCACSHLHKASIKSFNSFQIAATITPFFALSDWAFLSHFLRYQKPQTLLVCGDF